MQPLIALKNLGDKIRSFYPVELLFGNIKYNLVSLFCWYLLFSIVNGWFGSTFGIPFLFLSPEYLGEVNHWSFIILGFSFGGFSIGFLTYSYIKLGPRYPFLATVARPFFRFSINNSLIPFVFICFYCFKMAEFQINEELATSWQVFTYIVSLLTGVVFFILVSLLYFFPISKNLNIIPIEENSNNPIASIVNKNDKWYDYFRKDKRRRYYYIGKGFKINQSRIVSHLHREVVEQVFSKNRINAFFFEIITILAFICLGFFIDYRIFEVPAAMSIVTLLTILHMLYSALSSWFNFWVWPILISLLISINIISVHFDFFRYTSYALGLDYNKNKLIPYNVENIKKNCTDSTLIATSKDNYITALNNWKRKQKKAKPKLIVLNTSGGGSRSALWTFLVLDKCDKETNGDLSEGLQMITGASGGMVGAALYRELLLRCKMGQLKKDHIINYAKNLSKDMLNKLCFSASTNDLLMRYKKYKYNGHYYTKERGSAFEAHLHQNTNNLMEHPLGYYSTPEKNGDIPVMIFSPTIVNDGRRLIMASQSMNFLNANKTLQESQTYENIDYLSFFKSNSPFSVRFSSVLRASATFPIIMPMVTMPTIPEIQLMDAGIRDNHGGKLSIDYLYALKSWIKENTSGVIIIESRDKKRLLKDDHFEQISLTQKVMVPFLNMLYNFEKVQTYNQEQLINLCETSFDFPVDIVTFNLRESKKDKISLSWRLTKKEKQKINQAINNIENKKALARLKELLK